MVLSAGLTAVTDALNAAALSTYDKVIVAYSGGKDSNACVLHLLECGVPREKIELWHHEIDGREGSTLMDWPVTPAYCRAFAAAVGVPIYFSWLEGGFEREMTKCDERKAPTHWENLDGTIGTAGGKRGKLSTRWKFPQKSADLSVRWCSSYLKIDVCATALRNQPRFRGIKTLMVTGERAQESAGRAKYKKFEPDKADNRNAKRDSSRRHVDHWRPIHSWLEEEVWAIHQRWGVNPHPAYHAGFARTSCQFCIFANPNQWASARAVSPERFQTVVNYEEFFGVTIDRKGRSLRMIADAGTPYTLDPEALAACRDHDYHGTIFPETEWALPLGAFGESDGPV